MEENYEESKNGVILDGFPRTIEQFYKCIDLVETSKIKMVNISIPDDIISNI